MLGSKHNERSFKAANSNFPLVTKLINTTLLFFVFLFQDDQIGEEKKHFKITGGCCVIVALFFLGKLYLANAGDSRFVLALVDLCNV